MKLEGSCHCGKVEFSLESNSPAPYQRCYCTACRKTSGGGGYAINIGGDAASLKVSGQEFVSVYKTDKDSSHQRHFCKECGTHMWAFNTKSPDLVHPVASAIDTELPVPRNNVHIFVESKASWVRVQKTPMDNEFEEYPKLSLLQWHEIYG